MEKNTLRRTAGFKFMDGEWEIVPVMVACDKDLKPQWPKTFKYKDHLFKFIKEGVRPLYEETVPGLEEVDTYQPTSEEQIRYLELHCERQHNQIAELVTQVNDLKRIIIHLRKKDQAKLPPPPTQ